MTLCVLNLRRAKGPSINYVVSKSAIFDPPSLWMAPNHVEKMYNQRDDLLTHFGLIGEIMRKSYSKYLVILLEEKKGKNQTIKFGNI